VGVMWGSSKVDKLTEGATCHKYENGEYVVYTPAKTVKAVSC